MTLNQIIAQLKKDLPKPMVQDGEILREMTKDEATDWYEFSANSQIQALADQAEAEAKATAKVAILERIGLTADELKTILG